MRATRSLIFALGLGLASGIQAQPAGEPAGEPEETFSETFDVRVINLEAVVEDKAGNRVEGLGSGDFEILIDGKSQPVEYFTEIRNRIAATPEAAAAPSAPAKNALAPPPGLAESGRLSTNYVIFIDLATSRPGRADAAAERLANQIAQIPPEDRIAVFAFDGSRLENLADWRDSRDRVLDSLRHLENRRNPLALAERQATDRLFERAGDFMDDAAASLEEVARRWSRELAATFTALSTTMRAAAPPPGRRVVLAFAGAWPRDLAAFLGVPPDAPDHIANRVRTFYPTQAYSGVYETANLLGYTLYLADLELGGVAAGSAENGSVEMASDALSRNQDRDFETDATLMRYADQTGGQALTSGFGSTALARVQDDLASFYWLGFSPKRQANDKNHKVEVRVKKPGLKVRSRKQFSDLSRKTEVDQELESRLLFSRTRAKQDFVVTAGEPERKRGEMLLPITFRIPLDLVLFVPKGGGYLADLELRVAALGEKGERSQVPSIPVKLEGPKPQPGQYATYETQLRLRPDNRRFVLGLYDKQGERLLVSTFELDQQ